MSNNSMEKDIVKLKEDFKVEVEERKIKQYGTEEIKTIFLIKGFNGNNIAEFLIREKDELDRVRTFFDLKPYLFKDFVAIQIDGKIQVALTSISYREFRSMDKDETDGNDIISLSLNYFKNELEVSFKYALETDPISSYTQIIRGSLRMYSRRTPLILEINNYTKTTSDGIENDIRNILNSILFDIEYTYGYGFETISLESLTKRLFRRTNRYTELPNERLNLIYKKYIPELIEYFHIGEKVDYLPFKFICYYHIIEYFSDKSAYLVVSDYIKKIILKPDFHTKTSHYIGQAVNFFKKENDRYTSDKIKIERVISQFINREELKTYLETIGLKEHFEKDIELNCSKPLKLSKIDFGNDSNFFQSLTKRIYAIRCSIVHSNPDFDDTKAIPFTPTPANLDILRIEIELIFEIARTIIVESKE